VSSDRLAGVVLASSLVLFFTLACGDGDGGGSTGPDPTGSIEITLTMAGEALDADGCVFTVDGAGAQRILASETATFRGLSVGQHEVAISDVAGNCQVLGGATRSVSVAADQTATVTFAVSCAAEVGGIEILVTTSGDDQDPDGYEVVVDGGVPQAIGVNGSVTAGGLAPGDHTVALEDVAANCSVGGGNPRTVAVAAGQTAATSFTVTCSSLAGSLRISASTGGEDLDEDGYEVVIDGGGPSAIGINGSMTAGGLVPSDYSVELQGEAFNCDVAGDNPRTVTVTAGQEAQVTFDVTCRFHLYDRIAFQSNRSGAWMLYAVDPYDQGAGVRALGLEGGHPAVSPDGLRIAYTFEDDIWVARSDGSAPARVTDTAAIDVHPTWAPGGDWIAFTRDDHIWIMQDDGTAQTSLNQPGSAPSWSPDGGRIAYVEDVNWGDITIIDADGGNEFNLVQFNAPESSPAWSPLGNYIGFVSYRDGAVAHVFVVDPAGGPETNMTIGLISTASQPTWAPAAVAGAFSSDDLGTFDIYYFVPGDPGVTRLTTSPANDSHPSWGGGN
jgi:TolB protein